jgi:4-amino-4-deoxy-L-arabinose transferase-like glycosyltransferase
MTVVGLAWPILMWLTPASDRPWIAGTSDNSIWSLIIGYNGFGRILGQSGGPGGNAGAGAGGGGAGGNLLFGGDTGPFRLLNDALGGQAGWLLGFAVVTGLGLLVATRLRRADARTGWLIAVGGSFLVTAVAFSQASGIFHPYYVSLLAPFIAGLVGAGVGEALRGDATMRIAFPLAVAAAAITELVVLHDNPGELGWIVPLLVLAAIGAGIAVWGPYGRQVRRAVIATVVAVLLVAPGAWAFQTLGHATNGTFPAGGPSSAGSFGGRGGRGAGGPGTQGGFGRRGSAGAQGAQAGFGAPPTAAQNGGTGGPPAGAGRAGGGFGAPPTGTPGSGTAAGGGGPFGGTSQSLTEAVAYAKSHGGGTVAIASQTGAAGTLISSGANVVAIGGFSGRESQVSVAWLADAVASGKVRWVLADGTGGMLRDDRVGASQALAVAQRVGKKVSSVSGLYDLQGLAQQLRAAAG